MKILLLGALGFGAWYIYRLANTVKNIKVSFGGIRGLKASKQGLTVSTSLEFDNLNGKAGFTITGVRLRLYIDGNKAAEIYDNTPFKVEAYTTARLDYDVSVGWTDMAKNVLSLLKDFNKKVKVEIRGVVYASGIAVDVSKPALAEFNPHNEINNFKGEIENLIGNAKEFGSVIKDIFKKKEEKAPAAAGLGNIQ